MTSSERPSPEPLLKKEPPPAILGGREFWKCSEIDKTLHATAWGGAKSPKIVHDFGCQLHGCAAH